MFNRMIEGSSNGIGISLCFQLWYQSNSQKQHWHEKALLGSLEISRKNYI